MTKIDENTQLTFDLKTIVLIIGGVSSLIGLYFALQKDIDEAKELPKPTITRTEYDLKDQLIRQTIMDTQKKLTKTATSWTK